MTSIFWWLADDSPRNPKRCSTTRRFVAWRRRNPGQDASTFWVFDRMWIECLARQLCWFIRAPGAARPRAVGSSGRGNGRRSDCSGGHARDLSAREQCGDPRSAQRSCALADAIQRVIDDPVTARLPGSVRPPNGGRPLFAPPRGPGTGRSLRQHSRISPIIEMTVRNSSVFFGCDQLAVGPHGLVSGLEHGSRGELVTPDIARR